jgi:spoIIIJ-associated protein
MHNIEITGKTISDAVEAGAKALELELSDVEYKVLDEGSKGFLGIGARPAKVLVWKVGTEYELEEKKTEEKPVKKAEKAVVKEEKKAEKAVAKEEKKAERPAAVEERKAEKPVNKQPKADKRAERNDKPAEVETAEPTESESLRAKLTEADKAKIVAVATDFLTSVFRSMNIDVKLDAGFVDNKQITVNMSGDDMGVIIGKRGQTLDSLQYLTNLVVNKGEYPYMNVTLDTEGYRVRRKETLEHLAFNLAKKAKHNRRSVSLEPMNPYERRIIHATLQNDRYVTTYSEGVEPYRYVVIALKNNYSNRRRYNNRYENTSATETTEE